MLSVIIDAWNGIVAEVATRMALQARHMTRWLVADDGFPRAIGAPARRALLAAGHRTLDDLAALPETVLLSLHGVGPKALSVLREALAARVTTASSTSTTPPAARPKR